MVNLSPTMLSWMSRTADIAIGPALLHGSTGMISSPRTEVGLVAAFVLGGVPAIARAWQPMLANAGYSLTVHSVFCHAQPQVRYKAKGSKTDSRCELADLLVVMDRKDWSGPWLRQAGLIQTKMAGRAGFVSLSGRSSQKQLSLYQAWPDFQFVDGDYGTDTYNLRSCKAEGIGTFGILDRHFKNSVNSPPTWTQSRVCPIPANVMGDPSIGDFLARMAGGKLSWQGYPADPQGSDDWSRLVRLLMTKTYQKTFKHNPTLGTTRAARGKSVVAFLAASPQEVKEAHAFAGRAEPPIEFEIVEDDRPGGISLLRIQIEKDE